MITRFNNPDNPNLQRVIIDAVWNNARSMPYIVSGIVLVGSYFGNGPREKFDEIKAYWGTFESFGGEDADAQQVADWGSSFPLKAALGLFPSWAQILNEESL